MTGSDHILSLRNAGFVRASRSVPGALFIGWFVVFAGYEWLRAKFGPVAITLDFEFLTQRISALEFLEIFFIARLIYLNRSPYQVSLTEALSTLIAITAGIVFIDRPFVVVSVLSIFLLFRFVSTPGLRWVVIALTIFFAQYNPILSNGSGLLHTAIAAIDARVLVSALNFVGYHVTGLGTVVRNPEETFSIEI